MGPAYSSDTTEKEETVPNKTLLITGALVFGIPYLVSASIAGDSSHQGDGHLWVPLVGPWLDLGDRGGLPTDSSQHDGEISNRVFLGIDGAMQAIGAIEIVSALVFPTTVQHERTTNVGSSEKRREAKSWWRVTPTKVGPTGYGLGAVGTF